jgi:hypothetical protein
MNEAFPLRGKSSVYPAFGDQASGTMLSVGVIL